MMAAPADSPKIITTWEDKAWAKIAPLVKMSTSTSPFLIAIAGFPGSGKTTATQNLKELIQFSDPSLGVCVVPLDGYHFPLASLKDGSTPYHTNAEDVSNPLLALMSCS